VHADDGAGGDPDDRLAAAQEDGEAVPFHGGVEPADRSCWRMLRGPTPLPSGPRWWRVYFLNYACAYSGSNLSDRIGYVLGENRRR
jgi:hypothetical protein